MKKYNVVLMFVFALMGFACDNPQNYHQDPFSSPPQDIYFQFVDANNEPIPNAYVGVINQNNKPLELHKTLAFTDLDGNICGDPDLDEPSFGNNQVTSAGCTNEEGIVRLQIDFSGQSFFTSGPNCDAGAYIFDLDLFIKTEDGQAEFAVETCNYIHDNTSPNQPEYVQVPEINAPVDDQ